MLSKAGADIGSLTYRREYVRSSWQGIASWTISTNLRDRTPMGLAMLNVGGTSHDVSEISGTFRILVDSLDFSDEQSSGWNWVYYLYYRQYTSRLDTTCEDLLFWTLKLLSSELRLYPFWRNYQRMLYWTLGYNDVTDFSEKLVDFILTLGGAEIIHESLSGGYNLFHRVIMDERDKANIRLLLTRSVDPYQVGIGFPGISQEDSPTSLAMYSFRKFILWRHGLADASVNVEKFVDQELEKNYELHPGWEKETLLDLFAYGHRSDLEAQNPMGCSDCDIVICFGSDNRVQPYWRHFLERIKQRIDPEHSAETNLQEDESEHAKSRTGMKSEEQEWESKSTDEFSPTDSSETLLESTTDFELPSGSGSTLKTDGHGYPATVSIRSECVYAKHELVCIECWLHYVRTGTRRQISSEGDESSFKVTSSEDEYFDVDGESSEDEFSPYHIHT